MCAQDFFDSLSLMHTSLEIALVQYIVRRGGGLLNMKENVAVFQVRENSSVISSVKPTFC
jgi:hypothetical protein